MWPVLDSSTTVTDAAGNVIRTVYGTEADGLEGLVAAREYPTYREDYRYDERDRVVQTRQILTPTLSYVTKQAYDPAGNVVSMEDAKQRTSLRRYDALGRLSEEISVDGGVTRYRYDVRDQVLEVRDAENNTHRFSYDKVGRKLTEARPMGQTIRYDYDPNGNVTLRESPNGAKRRYGVGRYRSVDPIGLSGGVNSIIYVGGNPIVGMDHLRLCEYCGELKSARWYAYAIGAEWSTRFRDEHLRIYMYVFGDVHVEVVIGCAENCDACTDREWTLHEYADGHTRFLVMVPEYIFPIPYRPITTARAIHEAHRWLKFRSKANDLLRSLIGDADPSEICKAKPENTNPVRLGFGGLLLLVTDFD